MVSPRLLRKTCRSRQLWIQLLQKLSLLIMTDWPTVKTSVDPLVRPYYTFKDELSLADGIVYKGQHAVIPSSMRPAMLEKIHKTHFGVGSCIRRAKVSLFWSGIISRTSVRHGHCVLSILVKTLKSPCSVMIFLMWKGKWHLARLTSAIFQQ